MPKPFLDISGQNVEESTPELLEKLGRFAEAATAYEGAEQWGKAARLWERAESFERAAELYARVRRFTEAGQCHARAHQHDLAGEAFARAGNPRAAADAFLAAESYLRAGEKYLEAGDAGAARDALESIGPESEDHAPARLLLVRLLQERELADGGDSPSPKRHGENPGADRVPNGPREPSLADLVPTAASLAGLPFTIGADQDSWWPGCELYRAVDQRSQKPCSLLVFARTALGTREETFGREVLRIQELRHPSVLRLEEVYLTAERGVLRFELATGTPLARRLAGSWRPTPSAALHLLHQACEGLEAAHELGVAHGWLSPNTILIGNSRQLHLAGFGLAGLPFAAGATALAYRAPELQPGDPPTAAGDMFSLGLLGIELLGAQLPASDASGGLLDPRTVRWPESLDGVVSETVRKVLLRCLANAPEKRPPATLLVHSLSSLGLAPGQLLQGRYEIRDEIGRGGMSRVYRAYDRVIAEEVAIKTLHAPALRDPKQERRLLREVQICRKISHPNVVRVHDLGQFPGGVFFTMELLDGEGLDRLIDRAAPLHLAEVRRIARQIALALAEAHRLEIIHRDLKPGNVILTEDRVKVLDFGIARMGEDGSQPSLTRAGEVVGSPLYMAPEQIQGHPLGGACDLYALGVIAFTMVTGREPFIGDDAVAVAYQHLRDAPPDPVELRPDLPAAWKELLDQLLAKRPHDRPASADALVAALDALPIPE